MGRRLTTDGEVKEAAQELVQQGVGLVAASLGSEGAIFVTQNQALRAYAPKVPIVSTVGAGGRHDGGADPLHGSRLLFGGDGAAVPSP